MKRKREFTIEEKYSWFYAIMNGRIECVISLLEEGFDVNTVIKESDPRHPVFMYDHGYIDGGLVQAAKFGQEEILDYLLSQGADRSKLKRVYQMAILYNQYDILDYFREKTEEGKILADEIPNQNSLIEDCKEAHISMILRILSYSKDVDLNSLFGLINYNRYIIDVANRMRADEFRVKNRVLFKYIADNYLKDFFESDFDFSKIQNKDDRKALINEYANTQKFKLPSVFEKIFYRAVSLIKVTKDVTKYFREIPKSLMSFFNVDIWSMILGFFNNDDMLVFIKGYILEKSKNIEHEKDSVMVSVVQSLADQGLVLKDVPKDGNCFFHAIAPHLGLNHGEVRDRVALHMQNNPELYRAFIVNGFEEFIARAAREGEWAGNELIQAAANHFGLRIVINQLRGPVLTIEGMGANLQEIQVLYTGNHYMALVEAPAASNSSIIEHEAIMPLLGEGVSAVFDSNLDHLS